jgi:predicted DNA-binding ribbon-helix-helix protein
MVSDFPNTPAVPDEDLKRHGALVRRNIRVRGRRTSIGLEPEIWDMLAEVCRREFCTIEVVCCHVVRRGCGSLASSLRVFILDYFCESATESGHRSAGHGQGMFLSEQQERLEMRKLKAERREPPDGSQRGRSEGV